MDELERKVLMLLSQGLAKSKDTYIGSRDASEFIPSVGRLELMRSIKHAHGDL